MENHQKVFIHNFANRYSCIGGECPLTCCNARRWGIALDEEEIEGYDRLEEPFRSRVMECINRERKVFKTREEVLGIKGPEGEMCPLLTKDGWCELVLNCGEDSLSNVCHLYPRNMTRVNDYFENYVDISCPVVANFLFDEVPIENQILEDAGYIGRTENVLEDVFNTTYEVKEFLSELFLSVDGYTAGKIYIFFEVVHAMEKILATEGYGPDTSAVLLSKYADDQIFSSILTSCEEAKSDEQKRGMMAKIGIEKSIGVLNQVNEICYNRLEKLDEHVAAWKNGVDIVKDLADFYAYRDEHWPKYLDRLMSYRISTGWLHTPVDDLPNTQKGEYFLTFLEMIAAMSYWKAHGNQITVDEFVFIICCLERVITHSPVIKAQLYKSIDEFEKGMNFNLFLLPVY